MMDVDQGPTSESIITITLEVVHLLTGEEYTVVKKSADHVTPDDTREMRRTLTSMLPSSSSQTQMPEGTNDWKIFELTNRIIHLLTGEVWKHLGHSTLHRNSAMKPHQQMTALEFQANHVDTDVNEESMTCKGDIDVEINAEINSLTQDTNGQIEEGTNTCKEKTIMDSDARAPRKLMYNQGALSIKEEVVPTISQVQDLENSMNEESDSDEASETYPAADHTLQYSSPHIKEESALFQERNAVNTDLPTIAHNPQYPSDHIKQEFVPDQEIDSADSFTQIDYLIPYTDECSEEDSDSPTAIGSSSAAAMENDGRFFKKSFSRSEQSKNATEKIYKCTECQKCFTRNADLVKHQKVHVQSQSIICSACGKTFAKNSMYVRHQRIHTGEKPFSCSDCGKSFAVSAHLITHQRIHTGEKPFACSDCGRSFNQKASLIKHRRTHTGEKPFVCADCGKCFTSSTNLTLHQRVHTGEKPYPCSVCGKSFRSSPNLISHQRIHTGEKPYSCSECGKFFTNSSVLVRHHRTHTGEKPFLCAECGKSFTRNSQLIKHQMIHAGQRPYSIT